MSSVVSGRRLHAVGRRARLGLVFVVLAVLVLAGTSSAHAATMIDTTGPSSWDPTNNYANSYTCCNPTLGEIITAPANDTLLDSYTLYVRSDPPNPLYTVTLRGEVYRWDLASSAPVGPNLWESAPRVVPLNRTWTELSFRPSNVRLVTGQRYILFISPNKDNPSGQATQSTGLATNSHPNAMQYDPSPVRAWAAFGDFTSPDFTSVRAWNCYGCASNTDLAFKATLLPGAQPPTVTTGPASGVTSSAATLSGAVNPNGVSVTDCHFEYGEATSYGARAPCEPPPGSGNNAADVSASVSGLKPNTTYHYRVVATNSSGNEGDGADLTLTTASRTPSNVFTVGSGTACGQGCLKVTVPGAGKLKATDAAVGNKRARAATYREKPRKKKHKPLIKRATATATGPGTVQLNLHPSSTGNKVLKQKGKLTVTVRVTFTPTVGTAASHIVTVTFKKKKKH